MSAFMVDHAHIHALLTFAQTRHMQDRLSYCVNQGAEVLSWNALGKVLLAENDRSVCHRYSDLVVDEAIAYTFKRFAPFSQTMQWDKVCVWIIKACDCFDYQACETDDYETTPAHNMIEAIRHAAIRALPGYDEAPWGITEMIAPKLRQA